MFNMTPETNTNRMRHYVNIQVNSKPESGPSQLTTTLFNILGPPNNKATFFFFKAKFLINAGFHWNLSSMLILA